MIFLCLLWGANTRKATVIKPPVLTNGLGETLNIYLWPRSGEIFGGAILVILFPFFPALTKPTITSQYNQDLLKPRKLRKTERL